MLSALSIRAGDIVLFGFLCFISVESEFECSSGSDGELNLRWCKGFSKQSWMPKRYNENQQSEGELKFGGFVEKRRSHIPPPTPAGLGGGGGGGSGVLRILSMDD